MIEFDILRQGEEAMSEEALQKAYEVMRSRIGEQTSRSEWFEVTQERINDFAAVTMDHQWIHIDVEKAKACLLYTSPSPRDRTRSRMPSSA